jgi:hypothetical protein
VADVQLQGGVLDVSIKQPYHYTTRIIRWYTDLIIEADVRLLDNSPERFGLIFRSDTQHRNFYAFRIAGDGTFSLDKHTPDNDFQPIYGPEPSPAVKTGSETNHLKVIVRGQQFVLYVNDQKVATVTDNSFSEGSAGVVACTCDGSNTLHVQFDNITIYRWPE